MSAQGKVMKEEEKRGKCVRRENEKVRKKEKM
jgi:hypothetical protein